MPYSARSATGASGSGSEPRAKSRIPSRATLATKGHIPLAQCPRGQHVHDVAWRVEVAALGLAQRDRHLAAAIDSDVLVVGVEDEQQIHIAGDLVVDGSLIMVRDRAEEDNGQ